MDNKVLLTAVAPTGQQLQVVHGDITSEEVDAIVNAANASLAHGGGVAGAIVRRGGAVIQSESAAWVREHGSVPTGQAAITCGGALPARYVIHAVGPVWGNRGDEVGLLHTTVQSVLAIADAHKMLSISCPAISSGIFGFPKPLAVQVIWEAVLSYLSTHPKSTLKVIRFCNIDKLTADLFYKEGLKHGGAPTVV